MSPVRYRLILAVICLVTIARVASTYHIFCATIDEPAHIAGGYNWLKGLRYPIEPSHPPLAQILFALPLVIHHAPEPVGTTDLQRGNELLYFDREYMHNVRRSRFGNLLFLATGIVGVAAWGRRVFDPTTGLVAAALWSLQPTILAHFGVATTDGAVAALLPWAMLALDRWIEQPSPRRSIALGIVCALGALGKFSFIPFFLAAAIVTLLFRRKAIVVKRHLLGVAIAFVALYAVIWAGYRFSFGTIMKSHPNAPTVVAVEMPHLRWLAEHVPIPAPEFFMSVGALGVHNHDGHLSYFMGEVRRFGWWDYFPVLLFYKTPIAFTLLFGWGAYLAIKRRQGIVPLAVGIAILLSVMPSQINIGVRHVMALYAPFALIAAYGAVTAWNETRGNAFGRSALAVLGIWFLASGAIAHPDYIAYFNEAAGEHADQIAVDSNLDWGQDWVRLIQWADRNKIDKIGIIYAGSIDLAKHPIHGYGVQPYTKTTGWIAASETGLKLAFTNEKDVGEPFRWLEEYRPVKKIGKSIRIYRIGE
jgi:hypothetical protein